MTRLFSLVSLLFFYFPKSKYVIHRLKKPKFQCEGSNWDLFSNQYLFQKSLLSLTLENHKHQLTPTVKNFNRLILSCHKWNISKKGPKSDLQAVKIRLGPFLEMFHVWQIRIKLWKFLGVNWCLWFSSVRDRRYFLNKYWFENKYQFDPLPWFTLVSWRESRLVKNMNTSTQCSRREKCVMWCLSTKKEMEHSDFSHFT